MPPGTAVRAQETRTLKQVLDAINFSTLRPAVTGSGKVDLEVAEEFKVVSVVGCTVRLHAERTYPEGPVVYDLTIPLADLEPEAKITNPLVSSSAPVPDYRGWRAGFTTRRLRRTVVLTGRAARRHFLRGHTLEFGFRDRAEAEKFAESFKPAVMMCAGRGSVKTKS